VRLKGRHLTRTRTTGGVSGRLPEKCPSCDVIVRSAVLRS